MARWKSLQEYTKKYGEGFVVDLWYNSEIDSSIIIINWGKIDFKKNKEK